MTVPDRTLSDPAHSLASLAHGAHANLISVHQRPILPLSCPRGLTNPREPITGFQIHRAPLSVSLQHPVLTLHRKHFPPLRLVPFDLTFRTLRGGQLFWEADLDPIKLAQ